MIALLFGLVAAHPLSPSALHLLDNGKQIEVQWRTPNQRPVGTDVRPVLPACDAVGEIHVRREADAIVQTTVLDCTGLTGREVGATGLEDAGTNVVVLAEGPEGVRRTLLDAANPSWTIPDVGEQEGVFARYLKLGVHHLWTGWDHMMLVVLLALALRPRQLVAAVTSFTLGHSVSLALSALDIVRLPSGPVELAIAGTLVWMAAEVGEDKALVIRRPWWVCGAIGLVHGLGFAGVLAETGLAEGALATSLFAFNLGLELGQLVVLAVAYALIRVATPWLRTATTWACGAVAAMWVIERW